QEGKEHMSVVNAIRNKIILRIFAVVRNGVMYEKNLNHSLI
ncbi:MAG: IS110 family transposase, partial [Chitinophagales bacterium]|nr:IS110 family transposase [Chitinophagales bacterium]MCG8331596.1 IS110 family transposase [Chitinophagales bacterium]